MAKTGKKKSSARTVRTDSVAISVSTQRPDRPLEIVAITGEKALSLARRNAAGVEPRLPAGVLEGLASDLRTLQAARPDAVDAHQASHVATMTRDEALQHAHELVSAVRQMVHRNRLPIDVQHAYGVGAQLGRGVVRDMIAAVNTIVRRARENPDEARSAGILPTDVDKLVVAGEALVGAGSAQRAKRAAAPLSTKARNQTANRIILATDRIGAAGAMFAAHDPSLRAEFEALIGAGARHDKPTKGPGPTAPPG